MASNILIFQLFLLSLIYALSNPSKLNSHLVKVNGAYTAATPHHTSRPSPTQIPYFGSQSRADPGERELIPWLGQRDAH